mgnify:CR=1 FL=1
MIGKETLELLKEALSESSYTVAVCGSGMLEEGGILGLKQEGRACEIEQEYGQSRRNCSTYPVFPGDRNCSMIFTGVRYWKRYQG